MDAEYIKGQGKPVDAFDQICKNLHDRYDEAIRKSIGDCDPAGTDYKTSNSGWSIEDITNECTQENGDNTCAVHACIAENAFITEFFTQLWSGKKPQHRHMHEHGFMPEEHCLLRHGEQELFSRYGMKNETVE